jgi:hypothetical protein
MDAGVVGNEFFLNPQVFVGVRHRVQVGHGADSGLAAPGAGFGAGGNGLLIGKTRLTQMHMDIHETGQNSIFTALGENRNNIPAVGSRKTKEFKSDVGVGHIKDSLPVRN